MGRNGPRASHALGGKQTLVCAPHHYRHSTYVRQVRNTHTMEAKFNKAVEIVQTLPKEGPIQPTQEDQLYVRTPFFFFIALSHNPQFYSYYKQGV